MNNRLSARVIFCVALIALGCGSGEDVVQPNPPGGPSNPPPSGGALTDEQRLAVLNDCRTFVNLLGDYTSEPVQQVIVAWLKTRPEIEDAGIASQNVWAYFHDGRIVNIVPAWFDDGDPGGRLENVISAAGKSNVSEVIGGRGQEFPLVKTGILFNGLGTAFLDDRWYIKNMFTFSETEYELTQQDATIDNLKAVKDQAIFYILTHGGVGFTKLRFFGDLVFSLWTSDTLTVAKEDKYKDDLANGALSYMLGLQNEGKGYEWHYGITQEFVKKHMKFAENALVYVDACSSMNSDSKPFSEQVLDKCGNKMGTYVGWSNPTSSITTRPTHRYIFDRMIAANDRSGTEQTPPQRPFDFVSVYNDMLTYPEVYNLGVSRAHGGRLAYNSRSKSEVMLTPSISYILISDYENMLAIHGIFGDGPVENGQVWINDKKIDFIVWSKNLIICNIDEAGINSFGNVKVSVNGHNSNEVPITSWTIPLTVTRDVAGVKTEAKLTLRLRADVHRYRTIPNATPISERPDSLGMGDEQSTLGWAFSNASFGTYTVSGARAAECSLAGCQIKETLASRSQGGDLLFDANPIGFKYGAYYRWSSDLKKLRVSLVVSVPNVVIDYSTTYRSCPGSDPQDQNYTLPEDVVITIPSDEHEVIEFEFDENFNIATGDKPKTKTFSWSLCNTSASWTTRVEWPAIEAQNRPTAETAARAFNMSTNPWIH